MSSTDGRRGRPSLLNCKSKSAPPQPGDEQNGGWPREQLEAMDAKFRERVERAFENGSERRQSTRPQNSQH
jgi:hypothetical protein